MALRKPQWSKVIRTKFTSSLNGCVFYASVGRPWFPFSTHIFIRSRHIFQQYFLFFRHGSPSKIFPIMASTASTGFSCFNVLEYYKWRVGGRKTNQRPTITILLIWTDCQTPVYAIWSCRYFWCHFQNVLKVQGGSIE